MEFTKESNQFFKLFVSKNAQFYYECIIRLIERSKEVPVLYERDAKELIIRCFREFQYDPETDDVEPDEEKKQENKKSAPAETAGTIITRFRKCGWLEKRELGRNGENTVTVSGRCRKVMETVRRIFDAQTDGMITNHIFSMYEILYSALEWKGGRQTRPYVNILEPLTDHEFDLREELAVLRDSISRIMNEVLKLDSANGLGAYMMKDEILNRFFRDYFFMKKDGTIPGMIAKINVLLARISIGDLHKRMIVDCSLSTKKTYEEAEAAVDARLSELEYFLNHGYDEQMAIIDEKIAAYYNLYASRISMIRNNSINTQNYLTKLLMALKDMPQEERDRTLMDLSQSMQLASYRLVGKRSFEQRIRKKTTDAPPAALIDFQVDEDEMERLTDSLYSVTSEKYGIDAAKRHIREKFRTGRSVLSVKDEPVATKEEALMIASAVIFSGADDFPYKAEFEDGKVTDHGIADITDFVITPDEEKMENEGAANSGTIASTKEEEDPYASDSL